MSNIVYLIGSCCHLVTLDEQLGVVRFTHYSVQEFLQGRSEFSGAQELVASTCLATIGLWRQFGLDVWGHKEEEKGLYCYAAENWHWHIQQLSAVSIRRVLPLTRKIFSDDRHFRVWNNRLRGIYFAEEVPSSNAPAYLAVCSYFGCTTAVEFFLLGETTGLDVKQYALCTAAAAGNQALVEMLLENQADTDAQGCSGDNALQLASNRGDEAIVRLLLNNRTDVDAQAGEYGNALQAAAEAHNERKSMMGFFSTYGDLPQGLLDYGHEAVARLLLENGAVSTLRAAYTVVHYKRRQRVETRRWLDYSWKTGRISMPRAANTAMHYVRQQMVNTGRWFDCSWKMGQMSMPWAVDTTLHCKRRHITDGRRRFGFSWKTGRMSMLKAVDTAMHCKRRHIVDTRR
jgi:hypothetical protein